MAERQWKVAEEIQTAHRPMGNVLEELRCKMCIHPSLLSHSAHRRICLQMHSCSQLFLRQIIVMRAVSQKLRTRVGRAASVGHDEKSAAIGKGSGKVTAAAKAA